MQLLYNRYEICMWMFLNGAGITVSNQRNAKTHNKMLNVDEMIRSISERFDSHRVQF